MHIIWLLVIKASPWLHICGKKKNIRKKRTWKIWSAWSMFCFFLGERAGAFCNWLDSLFTVWLSSSIVRLCGWVTRITYEKSTGTIRRCRAKIVLMTEQRQSKKTSMTVSFPPHSPPISTWSEYKFPPPPTYTDELIGSISDGAHIGGGNLLNRTKQDTISERNCNLTFVKSERENQSM